MRSNLINTQLFDLKDGVYISKNTPSYFLEFEKAYLTVREKEKHILSIDEIKQLPNPNKENPHFDLWKIRRKNINRFLSYLSKRQTSLRILDVGCGNGFFTNLIKGRDNVVVGLDINLTELKQAAKAFPNDSVKWVYGDVMNPNSFTDKFDIITFCTSFHYFKEPQKLLEACKALLNRQGEIHIIDSPFYNNGQKAAAEEASKKYYEQIGGEAMKNYYFHNSYEILKTVKYKIMYSPKGWKQKYFRIKDSPFPWIIVIN